MKRLARLGFSLAVIAAILALAGAFGYQAGMMNAGTALFTFITYGAYVGGAAAAISLIALVGVLAVGPRGGIAAVMAVVGLVVGGAAIGIPASYRLYIDRNAIPSIHDITTDTEDPPVFVDVLPLRANAPNKVEYGGPELAATQKKAYPDLKPVVLELPPGQAFDRALEAVQDMGWDLVVANREERRIEATDTTFWFRFKDDVVIRLRPEERGTRVDVRSVSRVGRGDAGTNARRIRAYVARLAS